MAVCSSGDSPRILGSGGAAHVFVHCSVWNHLELFICEIGALNENFLGLLRNYLYGSSVCSVRLSHICDLLNFCWCRYLHYWNYLNNFDVTCCVVVRWYLVFLRFLPIYVAKGSGLVVNVYRSSIALYSNDSWMNCRVVASIWSHFHYHCDCGTEICSRWGSCALLILVPLTSAFGTSTSLKFVFGVRLLMFMRSWCMLRLAAFSMLEIAIWIGSDGCILPPNRNQSLRCPSILFPHCAMG